MANEQLVVGWAQLGEERRLPRDGCGGVAPMEGRDTALMLGSCRKP